MYRILASKKIFLYTRCSPNLQIEDEVTFFCQMELVLVLLRWLQRYPLPVLLSFLKFPTPYCVTDPCCAIYLSILYLLTSVPTYHF